MFVLVNTTLNHLAGNYAWFIPPEPQASGQFGKKNAPKFKLFLQKLCRVFNFSLLMVLDDEALARESGLIENYSRNFEFLPR